MWPGRSSRPGGSRWSRGAAELAVVGGRGHGLVTGALLGSAARSILRRLPIPVTVVRDTVHRR